jgi:PKD domain
VAIAATSVLLGCLAPAAASAGWLPAVDLSAEGEFGFEQEPKIAVGAPGDAVAVWPQLQGSYIVQAASKLPGSGWGAAVNLSPPGKEAIEPRVAMNASGQAVAVWASLASQVTVKAKRRSAGGSWGAVEELSIPGGGASYLDVAIDPTGRAVAAWSRLDQRGPSTYFVEAATSSPDGKWGPPIKLSAPGNNAWRPKLAVDVTGHVVAVWDRYNDSDNTIIQAAEEDLGGAWSEPQDLSSPGANAWFPVVESVAGRTVVLWQREEIIEAAIREPGGTWQPPVEVSGTGSEDPAIGMDGAGRAVAIWSTKAFLASNAEVATLSSAGSWSEPVTIAETLAGEAHPQVAVDPAGQAMAVWTGWDGSRQVIEADSGQVGGGWEDPTLISPPGRWSHRADLAMDNQGNAAVAWRSSASGAFQAAPFDTTAPELRSVSIPQTSRAGRALSFTAAPFDAWSAVTPSSWTFGDGASATGSAVAHFFAQAGRYRVAITATDTAGHPTSASGLVDVTPALAVSVRVVTVKGGKVRLKLHCFGSAVCHGGAILTRKLGRKGRGRPIQIARTEFSIPPETPQTVTAKLSRKGRALLSVASKRGLLARLTGDGVESRSVSLRRVRMHLR